MRKMSQLYKIAFSALFIALGVILSRVLSINFLAGLPFLKISLTMSVVLFSSFYLGPIYGTIISFAIDFIGALLMPIGPYDFLYSIPAIVQGFTPFLLYVLFIKIHADRKYPIVLGILLLLMNAIVITFVLTHTNVKVTGEDSITITPTLKWVIPLVSFLVSLIFYIGVIIFKTRFKDSRFNQNYSLYVLVISVILTYFAFKIPISSWVTSYRMGFSFELVYGAKSLTAFLSMFIHIIIVCLALSLSLKIGVRGALLSPKLAISREINQEERNK